MPLLPWRTPGRLLHLPADVVALGIAAGYAHACSCVPDPACAVHGHQPQSTVTVTHHPDGGTSWVLNYPPGTVQPPIYFGHTAPTDEQWKREQFGDGAIQ